MCGIAGAISNTDSVAKKLIKILYVLEYRGYDSSGISTISNKKNLQTVKVVGKIKDLEKKALSNPIVGSIGIAHTRWATHGKITKKNAHPHIISNRISIVHNGIIENYQEILDSLIKYKATSETDSEVIGICVLHFLKIKNDILFAIKNTVKMLKGKFSFALIDKDNNQRIIAHRHGCPIIIGISEKYNYISSDIYAMPKDVSKFIYLEENDTAMIYKDNIIIYDNKYKLTNRKVNEMNGPMLNSPKKGDHTNFMHKEIFEQPKSIESTLNKLTIEKYSNKIKAKNISQIQIIGCGTSYHAGLISKFWIEEILQILCLVEIASEFKYKKKILTKNTLLIAISQSGETADTIEAIQSIKNQKDKFISIIGICNVLNSSLSKEVDICLHTYAGAEISVATTKGFTTQLTALLIFIVYLKEEINSKCILLSKIKKDIKKIPYYVKKTLLIEDKVKILSNIFIRKNNALFLGRNIYYPVAMEGALKLKELSYVHAEACAGGELKHGTLALIDSNIPIVALAHNDNLFKKIINNIQEAHARNGRILILSNSKIDKFKQLKNINLLTIPNSPNIISPILYSIALQLLSYHTAILKKKNIDQPRNLAKSVTVE